MYVTYLNNSTKLTEYQLFCRERISAKIKNNEGSERTKPKNCLLYF